MTRLLLAAITLAIAGCAATYAPPVTTYKATATAVPLAKADLLIRVKRALAADGFQITHSDDTAGVLAVAPRNFRITPAMADCGTTMGIDYLKDNRTDTKLGYSLLISEGSFTVRAVVEAQYKPGAIDQNITLSCVSRGQLEADLIERVRTMPAA